jgi:hypothetical protein
MVSNMAIQIPEPLKSFLNDLSKDDATVVYEWLLSLDDRDGKTIVIIEDALVNSHCHLLV